MNWLKALAESLFSSLFQSIAAWWKEEQAAAAASAAKAREAQLNSVREGMAVQAEIARKTVEAAQKAPATGAGWNAGLLLLLCCLLSGCFRFHVYASPYQPVPPHVPRPVLDESPFSEREQALVSYAVQLEAALHAVRAYAIAKNQDQGYPVDPADLEWLKLYRSK
jgi:hypothetical protein